ncbi:unnamed protein product [Dicrocoelium dendriticum]|nr:unnamed protein product [Dicrocoelium dendriticum]
MDAFRQTFSKGSFNVIILVTDYYKNSTALMDYIQVGELFITSDKSADKTGCLDVFYKNSKYIFFLKNAISSSNTTYQVIANPIRFKEQISAMIRALTCSGCYAPTIEKLTNQQLQHGSTLTMTCAVKGRPRPVILWLKNGRSINLADKGITVEQIRPSDEDTESVLEITNVIRIDSGEYKCLASNHLGEASATFSLRGK